jgi:alpha-ketoglutarate-dependent taurine dioxygenase
VSVALAPKITPIDATLGAVITDVDLTRLDDTNWRAIEDAFHKYGLLIFPAQHLSAEAQTVFAERFGRVEQLVPGYDAVPISIANAMAH